MACRPPVSYANPRNLAEVQAPLRDRLWTAMRNAPRGGLILISGKRSPWQQYLLRGSHGCLGRECDPSCRCHPSTATVGRSHHENRSPTMAAADMGGIDLGWLGAHERDYGIARVVPGERWHFEVVGPPRIRIIRYGYQGNPNEGHHWIKFGAGDIDGQRGSIYLRGGYDNQVAEYQIRLKKLSKAGWAACDPGPIDGVFGGEQSRTAKASRGFHRRIQEVQKATGQKIWPKATSYVGPVKIGMIRWWTA